MGSLCCVAARPDGSAGSNEPDRWSSNQISQPSSSARWKNKGLPEDLAVIENARNSFSSSDKRSQGSRIESAYFQAHQFSPSGSFFSTSDLNTSPVITMGFDEIQAFPSAGHSTASTPTSESISPHLVGGDLTRLRKQPSSSRNAVTGNSYVAKRTKPYSNHLLSRQISDSRIYAMNVEHNNSVPLTQRRHSCRWTGSVGESATASTSSASDWWSMQTFSELVACSRKERLKWSDASSLSDFGWIIEQDPLNTDGTQDPSLQVPSAPSKTDMQVCGICSRLLTQKSPWSGQRMMLVSDLSVVGVLVCGHVYHADCLEQITSESDSADPPCPLCGPPGRKESMESLKSIKGKNGLKISSSQSQFTTKNKLSRIGIATDDIIEPEFSFQSNGLPNVIEQARATRCGGKPHGQASSSDRGKRSLTFPRSIKQFSFRGKSLKELTIGDFGRRKPEVFPRPLENSDMNGSPVLSNRRKTWPSSFIKFRWP